MERDQPSTANNKGLNYCTSLKQTPNTMVVRAVWTDNRRALCCHARRLGCSVWNRSTFQICSVVKGCHQQLALQPPHTRAVMWSKRRARIDSKTSSICSLPLLKDGTAAQLASLCTGRLLLAAMIQSKRCRCEGHDDSANPPAPKG